MDAATRAPQLLRIDGVFLYLYRLMGLAGPITQLVFLTAKAWGAALLTGTPSTRAGRAQLWLGDKLTGAIPFGWDAALLNLTLTALFIAVIHPASLRWILSLPSGL